MIQFMLLAVFKSERFMLTCKLRTFSFLQAAPFTSCGPGNKTVSTVNVKKQDKILIILLLLCFY